MVSTTLSASTARLSAANLADRFGFTLDELALNRKGKFSARQRQTVFFRSWGYLARGMVLAVISVGAAIMVIHTESDGNAILIGVITVLCALNVALLSLNGYRVMRPTIRIVTGQMQRGEDAWRPSIRVGDTVIQTSTRRWRHLETEFSGIYRAYLDPTGRLLSIEPAEKDTLS